MPTIGEALASAEQALFVGRDVELDGFARWLADESGSEILEVSGPGGIGKTTLLSAFRRYALARGRTVVEVDLHGAAAASPETFLTRLGGPTVAAAARQLNSTLPLILFDTFEAAGDLQRLLAEELLPSLETAVKIVIAGRFRLSHIWRIERPRRVAIRSISLEGLRPSASRAYLNRRGLSDPRLIGQILAVVGGHPLALSLAADLALTTGARSFTASPERHLLIRSLAEQLLRDVADAGLRELIQASAVVEQFDQSTLEAVIGGTTSASAFDQLCRLSVVRPAAHGLRLHDEVRRILADDLRWRHQQKYAELRLRALAYFRERMHTATTADREWLLAQRFYLWEHGFVQTMLFGQDDPGEVWVEAGSADDEADALDIEMVWHTQIIPALGMAKYELDPEHDVDAHARDMARLLALPGRRLRIARGQDGQALGFSLVAFVSSETYGYLVEHRIFGPLLRAYSDTFATDGLPLSENANQIAYFLQVTHKGIQPEAVTAALMRDLFGVLEREGVVLITVALPAHKQLMHAMGFDRLPVEYPPIWGSDFRTEAYMLDLRRVGLEVWIEAVMAGRRPPRVLSLDELEAGLQEAFTLWQDDARLLHSALAQSSAIARLTGGSPSAESVRALLRDTLQRALVEAPPDLALAYRAVERAYFERTGSHERVAEDLAVSRTTFYRLLRRGVRGLAQVLAVS